MMALMESKENKDDMESLEGLDEEVLKAPEVVLY